MTDENLSRIKARIDGSGGILNAERVLPSLKHMPLASENKKLVRARNLRRSDPITPSE